MAIEIRYCEICNAVFHAERWYKKYTCSKMCSGKRAKNTNLVRYGVEFPTQSAEIYNKIKSTNLEKYGVESSLLADSVKKKIQATHKEKYGGHSSNSEAVIQKKKITCLERYGVESYSQTDEFITKSKETSLEKFGVDNVFKDTAKIKNSYREKLGVDHPMHLNSVKDKLRHTSLKKFGSVYPQQAHITDEAKLKIESANWLYDNYITLDRTIADISAELGTGYTYVLGKLNSAGIPITRKKFSNFEIEIYNFVSKFTVAVRNNKDIIGKELDIFLPEFNIAIECNGAYWHSELNNKDKNYHLNKTRLCNEKSITLLHIWDYQWAENRPLVESRITSYLQANTRIFARNCKISKISASTSNEFLNKNHIQGGCNSSIKYGLFYLDELVAVMTFGKPRFTKLAEFELIRFASKQNLNVIGGASKLFSTFRKDHSPASIVSYSSKSFNKGSVYSILGFKNAGTSPPGFMYTDDYKTFHSRMKYQKHKLPTMLGNFNNSMTEWENMQNNGYDRIWDCGNDVWIWNT